MVKFQNTKKARAREESRKPIEAIRVTRKQKKSEKPSKSAEDKESEVGSLIETLLNLLFFFFNFDFKINEHFLN